MLRNGSLCHSCVQERNSRAGPHQWAVSSVGSRGDSYDTALAEAFNGPDQPERIRHCGPWQRLQGVVDATREYVAWFHRRLQGALGMLPPAEVEATCYRPPAPALLARSQESGPLQDPGRFSGGLQAVGVPKLSRGNVRGSRT